MREAFQLYTGCQPIDWIVEGMHPAAKKIGLTRQAVIDVVEEGRLRSARLYDQAAIPSDITLIASSRRAFSCSRRLMSLGHPAQQQPSVHTSFPKPAGS